jgi:hypothetical protein
LDVFRISEILKLQRASQIVTKGLEDGLAGTQLKNGA